MFCNLTNFAAEIKTYNYMTGNFIMLQDGELKAFITEIVQEILNGQKPVEQASLEEEYYTRDQVCDHLHVSTTKLWRMEKDGDITAYKLGRRSLYSKKAVDELIKSKNVNAKK